VATVREARQARSRPLSLSGPPSRRARNPDLGADGRPPVARCAHVGSPRCAGTSARGDGSERDAPADGPAGMSAEASADGGGGTWQGVARSVAEGAHSAMLPAAESWVSRDGARGRVVERARATVGMACICRQTRRGRLL
jgi:hypothetical protein